MKKEKVAGTIVADVAQWSEKCQRYVQAGITKTYKDYNFSCMRCKEACVFTAAEQKYAYETKKANINQKRKLCPACWSRSHQIKLELENFKIAWAESKKNMKSNREFLSKWLTLLDELKQYTSNKHDTATQRMLKKLLQNT